MSNPSFLAELKRRNVIRMAGLYLVGAWLMVQVAGTVLPMFGAPDWIGRSLVLLLAIGFLPALVFAWVFELTPQGIKRDAEVAPEQSIAPQTARRMDRMIIVVLLLALAYFGFDKFVLAPRREALQVSAAVSHVAMQAEATAGNKSIAVLPFVNMSGDPKNDYFSDGITEEILNALAQIPDLKVAARTSAFAFKDKNQDLRKVGEILGVATVLEGSVQRAGDEVRITAQLIDTHSGYHLWSETYDRKLTSIFAVEDEISKAIADKLQLQLGGAHTDVAGNTGNSQAHELYLRGLSLLAARGPGLRDAADAFRQAVQLDPQYARAWGALAEAEELLPPYGLDTLQAALPRAESAVQRALAIDPDTASAHVALGNLYIYRFQWPQADLTLRRALALAPGDAEAVDQYAQFLAITGQFEPALREMDHAQRLDPLSAIIGVSRAAVLMALHHDDAAKAQLESTLTTHPDFMLARAEAALLDIGNQRYPQVEVQLRAMARILGVDADAMALLAQGMADPALRSAALHSLETAPATAFLRNDGLFHAAFLTALGEHERAIDQLELYASGNDNSFGGLLWIGSFDPLRNNQRFKAVMKKMGLPYRATPAPAP